MFAGTTMFNSGVSRSAGYRKKPDSKLIWAFNEMQDRKRASNLTDFFRSCNISRIKEEQILVEDWLWLCPLSSELNSAPIHLRVPSHGFKKYVQSYTSFEVPRTYAY